MFKTLTEVQGAMENAQYICSQWHNSNFKWGTYFAGRQVRWESIY